MPALSVVMPTRNQAEFLPAAAASVLSQGDDLELVVADGASTDGTPALLAELERAHPGRVRWVSEPDRGPADAVNKAVAMAGAPVIGWLNSDDLYTPGAAPRALAALERHPDWVMVYGEGEHVDLQGHSLGRYPTRPPSTALTAWRDGCHICQPTAFFRREAFTALGGLDTGLKTAFDFEFWLRLFKAYPGRVGAVPEVQAHSRLHEGGITLRMREQVAMEGLEVIARHLQWAPNHWLVTHAGEALAACPFESDLDTVKRRLDTLVEQATPWLAPGAADRLRREIRTHRAWQIARPGFVADITPDGWAPPAIRMRLRQGATPWRRLRLYGRHSGPVRQPLVLRVEGLGPAGDAWRGGSTANAGFNVAIPLPAEPHTDWRFTLHASPTFVPARSLPGATDTRTLTFQLDAVELS